jgi:hypothetical protein
MICKGVVVTTEQELLEIDNVTMPLPDPVASRTWVSQREGDPTLLIAGPVDDHEQKITELSLETALRKMVSPGFASIGFP